MRPLHESHAYETALVLTEAFLIDKQPPEFFWMLCALWPAAQSLCMSGNYVIYASK